MAMMAACGFLSGFGALTGAGFALHWSRDCAGRAKKLSGCVQAKSRDGAWCTQPLGCAAAQVKGAVQLPWGAWLGWLAKAPSLQPSADLRAEFYAAPFEAAIRGKARCPEPLIGEITKREAVILHVRLLCGSVLFCRPLDGFAAAGHLSLPLASCAALQCLAASTSW